MHFFSNTGLVCAVMAASFSLLASAEPIPAKALESRQYWNYCCIPGCQQCSTFGCSPTSCDDVTFNTCCSEGRREVAHNGTITRFNLNNEVMSFGDF
ncbi:hypothetical protein F4819DRAFT_483607 [Hypoxylon fuscum]|nr:hypothetical protein F4819DRAFT_483607 [Hypoxylon fuscum]